MSSMIKKKGALSFKPKVPRRAPPPSQSSSTPRPSVDRQSETPAPSARPTPALSPPPSGEPSGFSAIDDVRVDNGPGAKSALQTQQSASELNHTSNELRSLSLSANTEPSASQQRSPVTSAQPGSPRAPLSLREQISTSERSLPTPPVSQLGGAQPEPLQSLRVQPVNSRNDESSQVVPVPSSVPSQHDGSQRPASASRHSESVAANPKAQYSPHIDPSLQTVRPNEVNTSVAGVTTSRKAPGSRSRNSRPSTAEDVNIDLSTMGAGESINAANIVLVAPLNVDGTSGTITTPITGRRKQPTKRKRQNDNNSVEVSETIEARAEKRTRVPKALIPKQPHKKKDKVSKPKKKRASTPEDAEEQEIDQSTVKMSELCKDPRIGRKFSKHDEIKQRELDRKIKAKLMKDQPELAAIEQGRTEISVEEEVIAEPTSNITFRVVNGAIVQDERSMLLDRHAEAAASMEVMEVVEENEFSKITNSGTYMKRVRSTQWDLESHEKFYTGIRMFGTDFEMISQMFPNRNRRQIKLKFNKEEREFPDRIHKALMGEKMEIDFEEYKQHTGLQYEETADIQKEYTATEEKNAADEAARAAELEKANRDKRAAIHGISYGADGAPAAGTDSAKENEAGGAFDDGKASAASRSKKGKGKKKKSQHSAHGGGEEAVELGDA